MDLLAEILKFFKLSMEDRVIEHVFFLALAALNRFEILGTLQKMGRARGIPSIQIQADGLFA